MCILFVKIIQVALYIHCHRVETQLQLIHIITTNTMLFPHFLSKHRRQMWAQNQVHNCTTEISQYLVATGGTGVAYFGKGISDLY